MMLCAVTDLTTKLKADPLINPRNFVCYGLALCYPPTPLFVLRLTLDFANNNFY